MQHVDAGLSEASPSAYVDCERTRWSLARSNGWARAHCSTGVRPAGLLRARLEDFRVHEILGFDPAAYSQASVESLPHAHWFLKIEKAGVDTPQLQRQLAERAGCKLRDIGCAGLKDKHAICVQWLSVPASCDEAALSRLGEWQQHGAGRWRLIDRQPQRKKLSRGAHRANRFHIRVRDVFAVEDSEQACDRNERLLDSLQAQVARITDTGLPNYFGEQRFGLNANNLPRAVSQLRTGKRMSRTQRGLYISALRSYLFNCYLHERLVADRWNQPECPDILMLDGSNSQFDYPADQGNAAYDRERADIAARLVQGDLHIAGPLFGSRENNRERAAGFSVGATSETSARDIYDCLDAVEVKFALRPLRVMPRELVLSRDGQDCVLEFTLQAGSFATALLRELFNYRDVQREPAMAAAS